MKCTLTSTPKYTLKLNLDEFKAELNHKNFYGIRSLFLHRDFKFSMHFYFGKLYGN